MGLKQSITIMNEFTRKMRNNKGTRGATPGQYVTRYMSRPNATETIAPATYFDGDAFVMRYMARKSATERAHTKQEVKQNIKEADGMSGIAFGYGSVSLSHQKLEEASKDIQKQFDNGKTVMKTVISFDTEYLIKHGILPKGFKVKQRGDLRGNVDQLKLRRAIMNGLKNLGRDYSDLQYIGTIQVDTKHVHCHLAMVDRGEGKRLTKDGMQKGMISKEGFKKIRHGIDLSLDREKHLQHMSSMIGVDRQNVKGYVKEYASKVVNERGGLQFLLACLPKDTNLWRASTNRKEMKKANTLAKSLVSDVLQEDGSGYQQLLRRLYDYADTRMERENLTVEERDKLVHKGRNRVIDECVNSVYRILKEIPERARNIITPMLETMSEPIEALSVSKEDPLLTFGYRLRSYKKRLNNHKETGKAFKDEYNHIKDIKVSKEGQVVLDYLQIERLYQERCAMKYQYMLPLESLDEETEEEMKDLINQKRYLDGLEQLVADESLVGIKPDMAERIGLEQYGVDGGRYLKKDKPRLLSRITKRTDAYGKALEEFQEKLRMKGYVFDGVGIKHQIEEPFEKVKALDLHEIGDDWAGETQISMQYINQFRKEAETRFNGYIHAKEYLESTGQGAYTSWFPTDDVLAMKAYADRFASGESSIKSTTDRTRSFKRGKTVSLDVGFETEVLNRIKDNVHQVEHDYDITD